ncbi:cupin domain-containing protein [Thermoleophilia bacterium SCSIO 60948]|nr:cupin domain-containing protein [Thermoleophilia bacterium SCSIO 60948]
MPTLKPRIVDTTAATPLIAPDGSAVRELVQRSSGAKASSVAEARIFAGGETREHLHRASEEIYMFTSGSGRMRLDEHEFEVEAGQAVVIPHGHSHKLWAAEGTALVLLCVCSPPYSDADTELLD